MASSTLSLGYVDMYPKENGVAQDVVYRLVGTEFPEDTPAYDQDNILFWRLGPGCGKPLIELEFLDFRYRKAETTSAGNTRSL